MRTAYFSRRRIPGVVLRVSRISHDVPAIASTHVRVSVAIPLRWPKKFRAVRSASKIARVSPRTVMRTVPACTNVPSCTSTAISVSPTSSRTARAISIPARTPLLRATKSAATFSVPDTVAIEVISSPPCRSSARARLMRSRSIITFLPPDIRSSNILLDQLAARCASSRHHSSLGNLHASENHASLV